MYAKVGDWLLVKSRSDTTRSRQGEIIAVTSPQGSPPYRVRWLDDGRETLVFPGPDSVVVSAAEQRRLDEQAAARGTRAQLEIAGRSGAHEKGVRTDG